MAPRTGSTAGVLWYSITTKDCQTACLQLNRGSGFDGWITSQAQLSPSQNNDPLTTKKNPVIGIGRNAIFHVGRVWAHCLCRCILDQARLDM